MHQLALDLIAEAPPSFDNFIAGPNAEALAVLRAIANGQAPARRVHLWGDSASGKTHLLRALVGTPLGPASAIPDFDIHPDPSYPVLAIDDCEQLDDAQQLSLFRLFNRHSDPGGSVIVTASQAAPIALDMLRPELRTRLGSGLVLALRLLTDAEREQALREAARASGVHCSDDVFRYLLTRKARDLRSLLAFFSALDRYALERQRPLTAALAREFDAQVAASLQARQPPQPPAAPKPPSEPG
jgi:DnaA family protein